MTEIGILICTVGWIVSLVGSIMVLIKAFQKSILWGLGSLFIPFVILVFVIMNWEDTKKGFLIALAGSGVAFVGIIIMVMFGAPVETLPLE